MRDLDRRLAEHLSTWLGAWPPAGGVNVVGSALRERPGWDGQVHRLLGVGTPEGLLLSVPRARVPAVRAVDLAPDDPRWGAHVAAAMGARGAFVGRAVFRSVRCLPDLEPLGEWVPADDPAVPAWLRPFGGEVLIVRDPTGAYIAGVGLKRHDHMGRELSVGTERAHRGRGLATRLVVTAARRVLDEGCVATYLHDRANTASARVADAAGFPDVGWSLYGM
jgi:GNAT superfamily N-acetyltransferase